MILLWGVLSAALAAGPADTDTACSGEVKAASTWLEGLALVASKGTLSLRPEIHLVSLEGRAVKLPATFTVLNLSPIEAWLDGKKLDGRATEAIQAALRDRKTELEAQDSGLDRPVAGYTVVMALDEDVKWNAVVAASEAALATGFNQIVLVFESPNVRLAPPEPSPVDAEVQAISRVFNPELKNERLSAVYRRILSPCAALNGAAVDAAAGGMPSDLIHAVAQALPQCDCGAVDLKSLKSVLWNSFSVESRTGVSLSLAANGRRVLQSALDPWDRTHRALVAAAKQNGPLRLRDGTESKSATPIKRSGKLK